MANSDQEKAIRKLEVRVNENTIDIVAIRGLLMALLLQSKEADAVLRQFVTNAAGNPAGRVEPEHAVSAANPLIEESSAQREKNRMR